MSAESRVSILCPRIGHGNPATALAIENLLKREGRFPDLVWFSWSQIPLEIFHLAMTASPWLGGRYSQDGNSWRSKILPIIGPVSRLELFLSQVEPGRDLVAIQEYPLAGFSRESLGRRYPGAKLLYIPDVQPKDSALQVAEKLDLTMVVWNQQAAEYLAGRRRVVLAQPVLPQGFMEPDKELGPRVDRIVVKSSGSGWPKTYTTNLRAALQELDFPFTMYLPDRRISNKGEEPLKGALEDRIREFYTDLIQAPPRVLITFPSEMIQFAAFLARQGLSLLTLPPRGRHEVINYEWARENWLLRASINPDKKGHLVGCIKDAFDNPSVPINIATLGLGISSISDAIRASVEQ